MRPAWTHLALTVRDMSASVAFYMTWCGLEKLDERGATADERGAGDLHVVWLGDPRLARQFILVLLETGAPDRGEADGSTAVGSPSRATDTGRPDLSHLGFALESREAVDAAAARAREDGILAWDTCDEPYPVGYFCGIRDPDGRIVELSFGQPLG